MYHKRDLASHRVSKDYWRIREDAIHESRGYCADCGERLPVRSIHMHHTYYERDLRQDSSRNVKILCFICHLRTHL